MNTPQTTQCKRSCKSCMRKVFIEETLDSDGPINIPLAVYTGNGIPEKLLVEFRWQNSISVITKRFAKSKGIRFEEIPSTMSPDSKEVKTGKLFIHLPCDDELREIPVLFEMIDDSYFILGRSALSKTLLSVISPPCLCILPKSHFTPDIEKRCEHRFKNDNSIYTIIIDGVTSSIRDVSFSGLSFKSIIKMEEKSNVDIIVQKDKSKFDLMVNFLAPIEIKNTSPILFMNRAQIIVSRDFDKFQTTISNDYLDRVFSFV